MDNRIAELHINNDNYEIVDANARYVITEVNRIFQQNMTRIVAQLSYVDSRLSYVESLLQHTLTYLEQQ